MMTPICTILCEDCGRFAVMHENALSIFLLDKDFFAMSRCLFCDRAVTDSVSKDVAIKLFFDNVKIFNFHTGERILNEKEFDLI